MTGLPLWKPTRILKPRKPLKSRPHSIPSDVKLDHELVYTERRATCECGWEGPISEFRAHQWAAANKEFMEVIKSTFHPRRPR